MALEVFELDFPRFIQLPSRFSAEPLAWEERMQLLYRVSRDGYIDDYASVRVLAAGKRFGIEQAVVWNLVDVAGKLHGKAPSRCRGALDHGFWPNAGPHGLSGRGVVCRR